jgi:hypothetical protein
MAVAFGRSMDSEAEHIIPPLARRAGEVSTAGRDTFLATLANQTLTAIVENLSEIRVLARALTPFFSRAFKFNDRNPSETQFSSNERATPDIAASFPWIVLTFYIAESKFAPNFRKPQKFSTRDG